MNVHANQPLKRSSSIHRAKCVNYVLFLHALRIQQVCSIFITMDTLTPRLLQRKLITLIIHLANSDFKNSKIYCDIYTCMRSCENFLKIDSLVLCTKCLTYMYNQRLGGKAIPQTCFKTLVILIHLFKFEINLLRADDTNKKIDAWIDIYFLTYFHSKLYK
jgi:hypothetical protein